MLVDFVRGELDDSTRDSVEAHLDDCDLCRAVMVELARFEPASEELAITDQSIAPEPVADPTKDPAAETYKVAPRLAEGDKVGRYVVLNKIGEGGMGVVYAAYDPELDRKVAIKLLMTSLGGSLDAEFAEQRTRLLREAQAMAKLRHPNVITVHDVGEFGEQVFVAMEFIGGGTLTDWLRTPRPWRERLATFLAAGRGLAAAHKADLVHRDFKPDNVLIDHEGRAVVTDFGLARPAAGKTDAFSTVKVMESTPVMSAQLTRTGALVGTPAYMAPEQLAGERSDALADQFAFCVTLYEGLYGHRPFEGRVLAELMANVSAGRVLPAPRDTDVPRRVRRAIARGLAVSPDERFDTMQALLDELSHDPSRTWKRWATILLPTSVLGVGLLAYQQTGSREDKFCGDLDAHLRGIWDDERKASLEQAFIATGQSFAGATWGRTESALDDYVSGWMSAQKAACEQSSSGSVPPAVMALRMQCLESQRRQLGTLVGVLQNIDANGLERARDAVDMLGAPSLCDDVDALARREAALDTPEKQALREKLDDMNTRAFAFQRTGKLAESGETAEEALALARAEGETWSEAEALATLAENREFQGRLEDAEDLQHAAMTAAISSGNDAVMVRVAIGRVWAGLDPGYEMSEAARWYEHGRAALSRGGNKVAHHNQLENGMAAGYIAHEQYEQAEVHVRRALDVHADTNPEDAFGMDSTWGTLGQLYSAQQQMDEAVDAFERSLEITRKRYGPAHPFMANAFENLGAAFGRKKDYKAAQQHLGQALEIRRIAMGDSHPGNANTLLNLSNIDRHLGDFEAARAKLIEAHGVVRKWQPGSTNEADILNRLGTVQRVLGDLDAAEASHTAAVEVVSAKEGMSPLGRARYLQALGRTLVAAGKLSEGRATLEESLSLVEDRESDDPYIASIRLMWALSYPGGVPIEQRPAVERAGAAASAFDDPLYAADALHMWARIAWANGDPRAAHQHAQAGRSVLQPLGPEGALQLEALDAWLREHPLG